MRYNIFLLLFAFSTWAHAEVLLTENFDYPLGDELTNHGWFCSFGGASGITTTNGLSYPGYAEDYVGNGAALIDVKSSSAQPHLPFVCRRSGDVYVSFLFQPTINLKSGYFFCLRDSLLSNNIFNYCARAFIGEDYKIGIAFSNNQKVQYSDVTFSPDKVYLLTVGYTIVDGAHNDVVSLYVNGEQVLSIMADATDTEIEPAHVVLRGYDTDGWLVVDAIRVATTLQEVLPMQTAIEHRAANLLPTKVLYNGHIYIRGTKKWY